MIFFLDNTLGGNSGRKLTFLRRGGAAAADAAPLAPKSQCLFTHSLAHVFNHIICS